MFPCRPTLEGQWYKFEDERVTKETEAKAVDDQFGGEDENPNPGLNNPPTFKYTKSSNAYMLVYIRKEDTDR
jgi:ubiquitin carboxyl-terminal hydrolase 7